MTVLIICVLIGLIPASIAQAKGRSFVGWWIYGALLFIVALPHALIIKPDQESLEREQIQSGSGRKCPACAEIVKAEARVCRFCGRDLPADTEAVDAEDALTKKFVEYVDSDGYLRRER
jgi:hypothetical protein